MEDDADVEETTIASTEDVGQKVEIKYVPVAVEEEEPEEQTIFEIVEEAPEFINGGMAGLMQYLSKNIKYPTIAQEMVRKVVLLYSLWLTETVVSLTPRL